MLTLVCLVPISLNSSDRTVPELMPLHIPANLPPCVPVIADANDHSLV